MEAVQEKLQADERLFNPCEIVPGTIPTQWICEDRRTGVSHLSIPEDEATGSPSNTLRKVIVISVHGACKWNGTEASKAAFGAWFGKDCGWVNDGDVLPESESQKSNAAVLYAAKRALEQTEDVIGIEPLSNSTVIIKTHSAYIAKCLSHHIQEWEENESHDTVAEASTNGLLFEAVENLIQEAVAENRFRVKFWLVEKKYNEDAITLANTGYDRKQYELSPPESNPLERSINYWMQKAHSDPLAQQLCQRLGISLPRSSITSGGFTGITAPIRRLVAMGEDTPPNFKRLFGPEWKDARAIREEWWTNRLDFLVPQRPRDPPRSPFRESLDADIRWQRPRKPTADDEKRIAQHLKTIAQNKRKEVISTTPIEDQTKNLSLGKSGFKPLKF